VSGIRLVLSTGNAAEKEAAKKMITNTFIGFVIVLAAWLLVDLVMKMLLVGGGGSIGIGGAPGAWNTIQCEVQPASIEVTTSLALVAGATLSERCDGSAMTGFSCGVQEADCIAGGGVPTTDLVSVPATVSCAYPASVYGGSCDPIIDTSNPCHESNPAMAAAFGSRAAEAAVICNKESGGAPVRSGSDLCCGPGANCSGAPSFSGGYFQVNILAHDNLIPGCDMGAIFTPNCIAGQPCQTEGTCVRRNGSGICTGWSCTITPGANYNNCLAATQDSTLNFDIAQQLFSSRGFQPWANSANICSVAF